LEHPSRRAWSDSGGEKCATRYPLQARRASQPVRNVSTGLICDFCNLSWWYGLPSTGLARSGTHRKTLPTSGSDSRRCLNSICSLQSKHSTTRRAMFTTWSRASLGFPANSKPVLARSKLQSCWVRACASIFSTPAYRIRSKARRQPASLCRPPRGSLRPLCATCPIHAKRLLKSRQRTID